MTQFRDRVRTAVGSGSITEEEALKSLERLDESWSAKTAKELGSAFKAMEVGYPDPKDRERAIQEVFNEVMPAYSVARDKTYKATSEEMAAQRAGMEKNRKYIEELDAIEAKIKGKNLPPQEVNDLLVPAKQQRQQTNMSEAQVDLAWALLPTSEKLYLLNRAGSPSEAARYAPGQGTMEAPANGHGGKLAEITPDERMARAKMGLKTYLDEGGRDMYSGVRYPITRMEWEHTIAVKNAGAGAETGANTGWTLQTTNRSKSDGSPSSVFKESKVKKSDAAVFNPLKQQASKTAAEDGAVLLGSALTAPGLIPKDRAAIIGEYLFSAYGVPKTFVAGEMTSGRASARRTEWMKTGQGIKLMERTAQRMQTMLEKGDTQGAAQLAEQIKRIPEQVTERLASQKSSAPGSAGSTAVMNEVLAEYMQ